MANARTYKKEYKPPVYEIAFDGVQYTKEDQEYLWRRLTQTLLDLRQQSLQSTT